MMLPVSSPVIPLSGASFLLLGVARCWRRARNRGEEVLPSLVRHLSDRGDAMLAPVLDSLILFYERALGRPMILGDTAAISDDERRLLALIDGKRNCRLSDCRDDAAKGLWFAVSSTRAMLALGQGTELRPA